MHALKGRKQSPEHIAKRAAALKGHAPTGGGRPVNTPEILWSKVDKRGPDECWPWKGYRNAQGYGRTWIGDKGYYAHRVIYDLAHPGEIALQAPKKASSTGFLRHRCDNPPCCNPAHLLIGTHADNMRDKIERGRQVSYTSIGSPRAKLTAEDVQWIRFHKKRGVSMVALEKLYEVSRATIHGVVYGRHYKDVPT